MIQVRRGIFKFLHVNASLFKNMFWHGHNQHSCLPIVSFTSISCFTRSHNHSTIHSEKLIRLSSQLVISFSFAIGNFFEFQIFHDFLLFMCPRNLSCHFLILYISVINVSIFLYSSSFFTCLVYGCSKYSCRITFLLTPDLSSSLTSLSSKSNSKEI